MLRAWQCSVQAGCQWGKCALHRRRMKKHPSEFGQLPGCLVSKTEEALKSRGNALSCLRTFPLEISLLKSISSWMPPHKPKSPFANIVLKRYRLRSTVSCAHPDRRWLHLGVRFVAALGDDDVRQLRGDVHVRLFQSVAGNESQPARRGRPDRRLADASVGWKSLLPVRVRPCSSANLAQRNPS